MTNSHLASQMFLALQYAFQGTLYGMQLKYLPIILRRTGSSLSLVGSLNLLTFPWLLKSLWAPIIDSYGEKNLWLSINYAGLAIALSLAKTENRTLFASALVLLNICSATVDLTLGKVLIVNFRGDNLSKASSLQIIGYKTGFLFGGGLALLLSDVYFSGKEILVPLAMIYFVLSTVLYVTKASSKPQVCHTTKSAGWSFPSCERISGLKQISGLTWMIICTCVYKFASHSSQSIFTMFLVDQGDSLSRLGFMSGIAGQIISIVVAAVCGILLTSKWMSPTQLLLLTSILTVFSVMFQLFAVSSGIHGNNTFIVFVFVLQNVVHGSQATPVYTLMLRCSQKAPPSVRTTCYSFLGTLEILGKQLSLFLAGVLAEFYGYVVGLSISLTVSILVVFLIWSCPVQLRKNSDSI
ncbi:major facilitator superfamily domain-containing protein 3-like [Montipora capricornis]|uniref:major facilitator superfamily domain-containing protein 3-like n=1 Tax=Montipora capricornis TaxID=246305 RepID=UPI0035F17ED0